jgi:phospholipase A1
LGIARCTFAAVIPIHMLQRRPVIFSVVIFLIFSITGRAQVSSLFNTTRAKSMSQRWELDTLTSSGTFVITPYKPIYLIPVRWSSHPNDKPHSGNPDENYDSDAIDFNNLEAKFQISFKVKVLQGIFNGHGDLWGAYTQKSHWQVYNKTLSSPFRETNYEPEVILNFATKYNLLGFKGRLASISFNHQSNGRDMPLSRSWNRIILQTGFERGDWQTYLKYWVRIPDGNDSDDNPDIIDRVGRAEAIAIYSKNRHILTFTGSTNFAINNNFSGYFEASWSYRVAGNLKAYLQFTHGYGETLIDYNNRQTTLGLGVSLIEWL